MFDIKISDTTIVDGSGNTPYRGDIGINSDRIIEIGDLSGIAAKRDLDGSGLTTLPGFIDTHSHADGVLLHAPQGVHSIAQGVTTEILTQDGMGWAPLSADKYEEHAKYLAGILGDPPLDLDMSSIKELRSHYDGKTGPNIAVLVPHGPVRLSVLGFTDAPLVGDHLKAAQELIYIGLQEGAVGLSTGLSYYPQSYSTTDELTALTDVIATNNSVYVTHVRNHNDDRAPEGSGIDEAMTIALRTGGKVHISHFMTRPNSAGEVAELMAPIDRAKESGADITLECYPYAANATIPGYFLRGQFHEGGLDGLLSNLKDSSLQDKLIDSLQNLFPGALEKAVFTRVVGEENRGLSGMSFVDVAAARGVPIEEMVIEVMKEEAASFGFRASTPASVATTRQVESDVMELLSRPDYMLGSDGIPLLEYEGLPHPRAYGSFARVIGPLRRRFGVPIEQITNRLTKLPAERFGLTDRGEIKVGNFADLVMLDEETVHDLATFEDPRTGPTGVYHVLVNGQPAVLDGQLTGDIAGRAIP